MTSVSDVVDMDNFFDALSGGTALTFEWGPAVGLATIIWFHLYCSRLLREKVNVEKRLLRFRGNIHNDFSGAV